MGYHRAMRDAEILEAAHHELRKLARPGNQRLWMSARSIASKLRRHPGFRELSQVRVFRVLMEHAASDNRRIRNSPLPSERTLEVLWAALGEHGVSEANVPPPVLTPPQGQPLHRELGEMEPSAAEEVVDWPPTHFISYNFADSADVGEVVNTLESEGHSIWMAGVRIAEGELINDKVIAALTSCKHQFIYLSTNSLMSLWVAKEMLVGAAMERPQTLILKGNDGQLMALVRDWLAGVRDSEHVTAYRGVSEHVASHFRDLLFEHLQSPDRTLYTFPEPVEPVHARVQPLSEFPAPGRT